MKKNIFIVGTKGGIGKTTLAHHQIPALFPMDTQIAIIEIDTHNKSQIQNSGMSFMNYPASQSSYAADSLMFATLNNPDRISILDAGAGENSDRLIDAIATHPKRQKMVKNGVFIIPATKRIKDAQNVLDTAKSIREKFIDADIKILLNRSYSSNLDNAKSEFPGIFGWREYDVKGIASDLKTIGIDEADYIVVPELEVITVAEDVKKSTLREFFADLTYKFDNQETIERDFVATANEIGYINFQTQLRTYEMLDKYLNQTLAPLMQVLLEA